MQITVGIIGYGEFGKFIMDLCQAKFKNLISCKVYSRSHKIDNKKFFSLNDVCQCKFIIPCTPIATFEETIRNIVELINPESILVEVCSVKVFPNKVLNKYASKLNFITTHPMFGPNSFNKDYEFAGKRVVITDSNIPEKEIKKLITILKAQNLEVVECSSHEHDELAAKTQFLTHLLAQMMQELKAKKTKIDTVSFRKLLETFDIVKTNKELFEQIYMYNPYTKEILKDFKKALDKISTNLNK